MTRFDSAPAINGRTNAKCADADTSQYSASPTTTSTIVSARGNTSVLTCRTRVVTVRGSSSCAAAELVTTPTSAISTAVHVRIPSSSRENPRRR